jgi:hypothetical protein
MADSVLIEMAKHYTYKVTFPGMPWYYWGVHTDNGKPYSGSPVTHKWLWDFYEFEVQILEWFGDRKKAETVEDRLIKYFMEDPNCLNEHCGGSFSQESRLRGARNAVKTNRKNGTSFFDPKIQSKGGKSNKPEHFSDAGKKGGSVAAEVNRENGTALFNPETRALGHRAGARVTNKRKYQCTVTGKISTSGPLTLWQVARGIDPSNRVELKGECK